MNNSQNFIPNYKYFFLKKFIESPNEKLDPKEFPEISSSFNLEDIKKSVLNLDFVRIGIFYTNSLS